MEIGVLGASAPEVRTQFFFRDDFIGAARIGTSLAGGPDNARTLCGLRSCRGIAQRGTSPDRSTTPCESLGSDERSSLSCRVSRMRCASRAIRIWSRSCRARASATARQTLIRIGQGLAGFELPVRTPEIVISAMWHPRMDADPAHRWAARHRDGGVPCGGARSRRGSPVTGTQTPGIGQARMIGRFSHSLRRVAPTTVL